MSAGTPARATCRSHRGGSAQCEAVGRSLAGAFVGAVYASPLQRARASAEPIAAPHKLAVRLEPAFREMDFGAWAGLTRAEVAVRFPEESEAWSARPPQCPAGRGRDGRRGRRAGGQRPG